MSQPHTEPAPLMYCRQCGYALVGLSANRCPECGQPFEPGDPRTFCRRLGCSATHRWLRRVLLALAVLLLLMAIASGGMMGWLSHRYDRQEAIARELRRVNASFSTSYLFAWVGWTWVRHNWLLSRYTYLLNCIDDVSIARADVTDDWLACLEGLPYLRRLRLCATPHVGDAGLKHLAKLDQLESLTLEYVPISDAGLEHLQHLLHLRTLALTGTRVTGPGLRYLKGLSQLYDLDLRQTPIGDEGLACLQELTRLERVGLGDTRITDDGLAYLESLEHLCVLDVSNTRIRPPIVLHHPTAVWLADAGHATPHSPAGLGRFIR